MIKKRNLIRSVAIMIHRYNIRKPITMFHKSQVYTTKSETSSGPFPNKHNQYMQFLGEAQKKSTKRFHK
jgi:hypothetical protein